MNKTQLTLTLAMVLLTQGCGDAPLPALVDGPSAAAVSAWRDSQLAAGHLVPLKGGGFMLEGDIFLADRSQLREYYRRYVSGVASAGLGAGLLIKKKSAESNNLWHPLVKRNLTYCVSNTFGSRKAEVVNGMWQAGRAWESRIDVRFIYKPEHDAACKGSDKVVFRVEPGSKHPAGDAARAKGEEVPGFGMHAFFPWSPHKQRVLMINSYRDNHAYKTLVQNLVHELGHILGFIHEFVVCKAPHAKLDQLTTYDPLSVMHYRASGDPCGTSPDKYDYFITPRDTAGARGVYGKARSRMVAFYHHSGRYLTVGSDKDNRMTASGKHLGQLQSFEMVELTGGKVALRGWNRRYVSALNGGGGKVVVNREQRAAWETFELVNLGQGEYALRTANKKLYLSVFGQQVYATPVTVGPVSRLTMVRLDAYPVALQSVGKPGRYMRVFKQNTTPTVKTKRIDRYSTLGLVYLPQGKVALRTHAGLYLSALKGGGAKVAVDRDKIQQWEMFNMLTQPDGSVAFGSHDGAHYLSYAGSSLRASATSPTQAKARFTRVHPTGDKLVVLKTHNGKFVSATNGGGGKVVSSDSGSGNFWHVFRLVELGGGEVALRTHRGNYVSVHNGGAGKVRADRVWIDGWETYKLQYHSGGKVSFRTAKGYYLYLSGSLSNTMVTHSMLLPPARFTMLEVF